MATAVICIVLTIVAILIAKKRTKLALLPERLRLGVTLASLDEAQKLRLAQCMKPPAAPSSAVQPASPAGGLRPPPVGRPPAISLKRF